LVLKVVTEFLTLTPAFDACILQMVECLVEVIKRHLVAKNTRRALGFTISLACFRRQSHRGDVARTQVLFGFAVMLLGARPAWLHLDNFFIQRNGNLVITFVKGFLSLIHHPLGFRVVCGLEEAPQRIAVDPGIEFSAEVGARQRRHILHFYSLPGRRTLKNGFGRCRRRCWCGCSWGWFTAGWSGLTSLPAGFLAPDLAQEPVGFFKLVDADIISEAIGRMRFQHGRELTFNLRKIFITWGWIC